MSVQVGGRVARILLLVVTLMASAVSGHAQDNAVGAGFSAVWIEGDYGRWHTYPGWSVEGERALTPHLVIAAEADGNWYSIDYSNGASESHRAYLFAAGPRLTTSRQARVTGFAQIMAGVLHSSVTLRMPPFPDFNASGSSFAIQPGGGVDAQMTRRTAVRADVGVAVADPWHSFSWQFPVWRVGLLGIYRW
jgi:hypothetical protein